MSDFLQQGKLFEDICAAAEGRWHELHPGSGCPWSRQDVKYYACTGQLRMAMIAEDCRGRYVVGANMIACGVMREYPDCEPRPELF